MEDWCPPELGELPCSECADGGRRLRAPRVLPLTAPPRMDARIVSAVLSRSTARDTAHDERDWRAVAATGLELAAETPGADPFIVELFGWLHDARPVPRNRPVGRARPGVPACSAAGANKLATHLTNQLSPETGAPQPAPARVPNRMRLPTCGPPSFPVCEHASQDETFHDRAWRASSDSLIAPSRSSLSSPRAWATVLSVFVPGRMVRSQERSPERVRAGGPASATYGSSAISRARLIATATCR
jgi:hypothetical protein